MNARHMTNARRVASARASFDLSARRSRARAQKRTAPRAERFCKNGRRAFRSESRRDLNRRSAHSRSLGAPTAERLPRARRDEARVRVPGGASLERRLDERGAETQSQTLRVVRLSKRQSGSFDSRGFRDVPPRTNDKSRLLARLGRLVRRRDAQTPPRARASASHVFHARSTTARDSRHSRDASCHASNAAWSANRTRDRGRAARRTTIVSFGRHVSRISRRRTRGALGYVEKKPSPSRRRASPRRDASSSRSRFRANASATRAPFRASRCARVRQRGAFVAASPLRGARLHEPTPPPERDDGGGGGRGDESLLITHPCVFSRLKTHGGAGRERLRRRPSRRFRRNGSSTVR